MKRTALALLLTTALSAPVAAQEARLSGTVAEAFGSQVVLATPEGRLLVTLPQGMAAPAPGARLNLAGTREGATFIAREATFVAQADRPRPPRPPASAQPRPPAPSASAQPLPPEVAELGLAEVATRSDRTRHGSFETHIHGRMPDGTWVRLKIRDGRLVEARSGDAALPRPLIDRILPPQMRDDPRLSEIARITEVDRKPEGEIEVEGFDARGDRIEIEFFADGRLRKLDRKRDDRRGPAEREVRATLERLGYGPVGYVDRGPRHAEAIAVNPYGDWVELRLNDRGEVDRERLWQR
jgi:hypothetical protein